MMHSTVILISLLFCNALQAANDSFSMPEAILNHVFNGYQNRDRPTDDNETPTVVVVNLQLLAITSVDVRKMQYTLDMYLRQRWVDQRLSWDKIDRFANFTDKIVSPEIKAKAWLPDLFFRNGKEGRVHKMTRENVLTRLKPTGDILYSQKVTMIFDCQMDLRTFPMDTQRCHINIGSYGYTVNELKFIWLNDKGKLPVKLAKTIQLSEFAAPQNVTTIDCSKQAATVTGAYSCLKASFVLTRQIGWWLTNTYVPNILAVMVSWLSFWISLEAVPARVTLGFLTLLVTLTQATAVSSKLPRVSYIKAIDVWTIACIIFNVSVLLEFAVAMKLAKKVRDNSWKQEVRDAVREELSRWCNACQKQLHVRGGFTKAPLDMANVAANAVLAMRSGNVELSQELRSLLVKHGFDDVPPLEPSVKQPSAKPSVVTTGTSNVNVQSKPPVVKASEIDEHSRLVFPVCFLLYNCFYWVYYLKIVQKFSDG